MSNQVKPPVETKGCWTNETVLAYLLAIQDADRAYFERLLREVKESAAMALSSTKEAVMKAEHATDRRFDSVNEFRQQLDDQARTFMPRKESELSMSSLSEKADKNAADIIAIRAALVSTSAERRAASAGSIQGWVLAVGAVSLVLTILTIVTVVITLYGKLARP